jgi:two-component system cell cycle sensor histidine kinase/response regulator CckA
LLAFARGSQYRKRVVRVADVTREIIGLLSHTLPKTVTIRDNIEVGDACVEADPSHLGQVLINLGTNASDAMNGIGTLTITAEIRDGQARLSVRDTGTGMDEATRSRVFEPFFTTKPLGRGTGLGLSTAWGIVRDHNGAIAVESALGAGTTFIVSLPLTAALPAVKPARASTDPIANAPHVLVIDDEAMVRESVKRVLGRIGVKVELAGDGASGLATFNAGKFDLVILDVGMPIMGGVECFRRIRATSKIPILIATGYAPDGELAELIASGATLIEKPYTPDDLRCEVARLLGADH